MKPYRTPITIALTVGFMVHGVNHARAQEVSNVDRKACPQCEVLKPDQIDAQKERRRQADLRELQRDRAELRAVQRALKKSLADQTQELESILQEKARLTGSEPEYHGLLENERSVKVELAELRGSLEEIRLELASLEKKMAELEPKADPNQALSANDLQKLSSALDTVLKLSALKGDVGECLKPNALPDLCRMRPKAEKLKEIQPSEQSAPKAPHADSLVTSGN